MLYCIYGMVTSSVSVGGVINFQYVTSYCFGTELINLN